MGNYLLISDAAKEVKVESHVLRYWEEELHLPIKRNELGHRYYTEADVERFRQIKSMKERGLQLKAIKMILKDGRLEVLPGEKEHGDDRELSGDAKMKEDAAAKTESMPALAIDIVERVPAFDASKVEANDFREESQNSQQVGAVNAVEQDAGALQESKEERTRKLQWVLQEMIREAVRDNNDLYAGR